MSRPVLRIHARKNDTFKTCRSLFNMCHSTCVITDRELLASKARGVNTIRELGQTVEEGHDHTNFKLDEGSFFFSHSKCQVLSYISH